MQDCVFYTFDVKTCIKSSINEPTTFIQFGKNTTSYLLHVCTGSNQQLCHFFAGYLEEGLLVTDTKKIRHNYFKQSTFIFDVLSVLPTDFLYFIPQIGPHATWVRHCTMYTILASTNTTTHVLVTVWNNWDCSTLTCYEINLFGLQIERKVDSLKQLIEKYTLFGYWESNLGDHSSAQYSALLGKNHSACECEVLVTNIIHTFSSLITLWATSSSSFGCSHLSEVATADVFKHPHRTFGSVLRRMPFLMQPTDSRET